MKSIRIIISFFLCLTLLLGLSASIIEVSATQSSDKFNKKYTLTGNGADDMVNIALAQEGKTGSEFGYSEQWCSDFVSDCAKLAGQSEAVPFNGNQINLRAAILKAGGTVTTSSPKAGDICFIDWTASGKEAGHVEIVYQVLNGAVYTIGGNTGSGNNLYTRYVKKHAPLPQKYISSIVRPKYSSNAPTTAPTDPFITASATIVAVNEEVTFNYGATNATWYRFGSFRNGELSVTEVWSNTSHTTSFSEAGVYIIHVQCMNKIGFVDSEDIVITVYDSAPTDPFITATATTVAVNEEVTFNYGATNATWYRFGSFRNGELSVTEVWSNTSHTASFSEAGVYIIHVQCMNKIGFVDSEDIVVTVYIPNAIVKIELNAVGGDCSISEISVNDSLPIGALPIPIRNGYNFDGWYTAASGGTKVTEETIFSANTTLYAHWSACDHNYTVIESVDSSCTKEGSKTLKCTKCGNTYNEKIEKKAHTAVIDNAVAVTCTTAGLTEGSHCSTCGAVIKARTTVPPTGHTDMNNDGLCDKCGKSLAPTAYPKLSIRTPSTATVSYGFTLNLHANVTDLPEGARIVWSMDGSGFELSPSADGMTCGVKSVSKGSATITAKVIDKNGNAVKDANVNEITASQKLTSKAGFFQKLAAFFKKLFGSNMVIPSSLNKLIK